jgi:hypothetical protein
LNTTTFSDPDFDDNISLGNISTTTEASPKPKMNSILLDATNRIRIRRGRAEPLKVKGDDGMPLALRKSDSKLPDQQNEENVQVTGDKLEQKCVPIEVRVEESERVATQETDVAVTVTEPVMTFVEDGVDFDDTLFNDSSNSGNTPSKLNLIEDGLLMTPVTEETCEDEVLTPVISNRNALTLVASTKEN